MDNKLQEENQDILMSEGIFDGRVAQKFIGSVKDKKDQFVAKWWQSKDYALIQIDELEKKLKNINSLEKLSNLTKFGNYTGQITFSTYENSDGHEERIEDYSSPSDMTESNRLKLAIYSFSILQSFLQLLKDNNDNKDINEYSDNNINTLKNAGFKPYRWNIKSDIDKIKEAAFSAVSTGLGNVSNIGVKNIIEMEKESFDKIFNRLDIYSIKLKSEDFLLVLISDKCEASIKLNGAFNIENVGNLIDKFNNISDTYEFGEAFAKAIRNSYDFRLSEVPFYFNTQLYKKELEKINTAHDERNILISRATEKVLDNLSNSLGKGEEAILVSELCEEIVKRFSAIIPGRKLSVSFIINHEIEPLNNLVLRVKFAFNAVNLDKVKNADKDTNKYVDKAKGDDLTVIASQLEDKNFTQGNQDSILEFKGRLGKSRQWNLRLMSKVIKANFILNFMFGDKSRTFIENPSLIKDLRNNLTTAFEALSKNENKENQDKLFSYFKGLEGTPIYKQLFASLHESTEMLEASKKGSSKKDGSSSDSSEEKKSEEETKNTEEKKPEEAKQSIKHVDMKRVKRVIEFIDLLCDNIHGKGFIEAWKRDVLDKIYSGCSEFEKSQWRNDGVVYKKADIKFSAGAESLSYDFYLSIEG